MNNSLKEHKDLIIYASNKSFSKRMKQKQVEQLGERDRSTVIQGDFSTFSLIINKKKKKINKDV